MMEPEIILEDWSPVCNIQAFVEKSETTYYFYLWVNCNSESPEIRNCWICNRVTAPEGVDYEAMEKGQAPCMPREYVRHDVDGMELDADQLKIQWFEEGDAAALLSDGQIIAVIPCFSGYNGFHGYSIYAKGTGTFAWELQNAMKSFESKVHRSEKFWTEMDTDFWGDVQASHMRTLEKFFGKYHNYYAIDGNEFPPKALVQGEKDGVLYGITAGVSIIPMPKVEMHYGDDYCDYRRMELGFACNKRHEAMTQMMYSTLSGLARFPWKAVTFLGHGHTIPFDSIKGYAALLFLNAKMVEGMEAPKYERYQGDEVNLLWAVPIKQEEYDFIVENDVDAYLEKLDSVKIHIFGQ